MLCAKNRFWAGLGTTGLAALLATGVAAAEKCNGKSATNAALKSEAKRDIVDTAVEAGSFQTLATALKAAGLVETLKGAGPFTVFAPTDEAFSKLPDGTLESLLKPENKDKLVAILTYHVVPGSVKAAEVVKLKDAETVQGQSLAITAQSGVQVDGANVVKADILCSNGVIHVVDNVLLPKADIVETAVSSGKFNTLVAAVKAAGLVETLKGKGPFTVFAPTDEAFEKLPAGTVESLLKPENKDKLTAILTYHVVPGRFSAEKVGTLSDAQTVQGTNLRFTTSEDGVMVNQSKVVAADIVCGNGVIHVIDSVLLPE